MRILQRDKYSHRINPFDTTKKKASTLFSLDAPITFGEGLNDSETIPVRFSEYLTDYHSYNFAYSGYGTQNLLANLQKPDIKVKVR